ncbi:MAG: spermidine/putrescine ABC transporter substrate-binding protein [Verrucomicrobia bacterium]|nr:spermidine/putrescine ABC transporter substrate-binding protein [Verrucomicrobiota bacterium]MCH8528129.1 spermidine/putrescine ABC transporter substrate-binding protein [Kiritimatiellia bacterium]
MKFRLLNLAAALMLILGFTACGSRKPVLRIYNWAEYLSDEVIEAFEKEFNCRVIVDVFDSNEAMYAKLKAGGGGYDIVVPSSYQVVRMAREGMLLELDHSQLPNLVHLDPIAVKFTQDPEHRYSVPYLITSAVIGYRADRMDTGPDSWAVFADASLRGRMTLLNDQRETLGAALKFLGFSLNTVNPEEINAARDLLIEWKANLAKFESEQFKNGLMSAEFLVVHGYSSDLLQAMEEDENISIALPKEGLSIALDDLVILADAPNPQLAHAFINFMHRPEVAAENMEWVMAMSPNLPAYALLDDAFKADERIFFSEEIFAKSETIFDLGENDQLYINAWNEVKTAP